MGLKEKVLKFAGPGGWAAAAALSVRNKMDKQSAPRQSVPNVPTGYYPDRRSASEHNFKQAGMILLAGIVLFYVMNLLGLKVTPMISTLLVIGVMVFAIARAAPHLFDTTIRLIAIYFTGIIGFTALAFIPIPLPNIFTTLFLLFYVIMVFSAAGKTRGFVVSFLYILFFVSMLYIPLYPDFFNTDTPLYNAFEGQRDAWVDIFKGGEQLAEKTKEGFERQILIATGNYESSVEAASSKKLGVFFQNVGATANIVDLEDTVDVYATLTAESFARDDELLIDVSCHPDMDDSIKGEILPTNTFAVNEYEIQEVDCIFDGVELGEGRHTIFMVAEYNFETSAFLKTYFMEKEQARELGRDGNNPLHAFKISDVDPSAIFSGGPMRIGMGVGKQPIRLSDSDIGPTLTVTFDRNWIEGELASVSNVELVSPPGVRIVSVNGKEDLSCSGGASDEQVCILSASTLNEIFTTSRGRVMTPKTIRVQTRVDDMQTVLSNAPLAIRSFKVSADYTFRTKNQVLVTVKRDDLT
jgi:hypothetical protein